MHDEIRRSGLVQALSKAGCLPHEAKHIPYDKLWEMARDHGLAKRTFNNLGVVTLLSNGEGALQDTFNRNARITQLLLKVNQPDVVTFSAVTIAGMPVNIGAREAAAELIYLIPLDEDVHVGQTIRVWLRNGGDSSVIVSGTCVTDELVGV